MSSARITVSASHFAPDDTLVMYVWPDLIAEHQQFNSVHRTFTASAVDGNYTFRIDSLGSQAWFSLGKDRCRVNGQLIPILTHFLLAPGDDVAITMVPRPGYKYLTQTLTDHGEEIIGEAEECIFSGPGSSRFRCQWAIGMLDWKSTARRVAKGHRTTKPGMAETYLNALKLHESRQRRALGLLDSFRNELGERTYQQILADCIGEFGHKKLGVLASPVWIGVHHPDTWPGPVMDSVRSLYRRYCLRTEGEGLAPEVRAKSFKYVAYLESKLMYDLRLMDPDAGMALHYEFLKGGQVGMLRDRLISHALLTRGTSFADIGYDILDDALSTIRDSLSNAQLNQLRNRQAGEKAYDFSLPDANGSVVTLGDLKGKVVFIDFWFASCGPCQQYYKNVVAPVHAEFVDQQDVCFVSVCTDNYDIFREEVLKANFTSGNAVNLFTDGMGFLHPVIKHYKIIGYPFPILIDKHGFVVSQGRALKSKEGLANAINQALSGP